MAKKAYIGVEGIAHKIKKGYIGVDNIAHKIKKAYIGIGGVARPCWSGGELAYYGTIAGAAAGLPASTKTHAMFISNSAALAYDAALTMYTPEKLSLSSSYSAIASTEVGNYGLFGGGGYMSGVSSFYHSSAVEAYDQSLTRSNAPNLTNSRRDASGSKGGKYGIFAGGQVYNSSGSSKESSVDAYDQSLTKVLSIRYGGISGNRYGMGSTAVGDYILFAGGSSSSPFATVDAFDASLTRTSPEALSVARERPAAATVGDYALFVGGSAGSGYVAPPVATVDVYDKYLTRINTPDLSTARRSIGATSVGNFALFAGGYGSANSATVDVYDSSLTHTLAADLSKARMPTAAAVGNFALFTGGNNNDVDVYTVA